MNNEPLLMAHNLWLMGNFTEFRFIFSCASYVFYVKFSDKAFPDSYISVENRKFKFWMAFEPPFLPESMMGFEENW